MSPTTLLLLCSLLFQVQANVHIVVKMKADDYLLELNVPGARATWPDCGPSHTCLQWKCDNTSTCGECCTVKDLQVPAGEPFQPGANDFIAFAVHNTINGSAYYCGGLQILDENNIIVASVPLEDSGMWCMESATNDPPAGWNEAGFDPLAAGWRRPVEFGGNCTIDGQIYPLVWTRIASTIGYLNFTAGYLFCHMPHWYPKIHVDPCRVLGLFPRVPEDSHIAACVSQCSNLAIVTCDSESYPVNGVYGTRTHVVDVFSNTPWGCAPMCFRDSDCANADRRKCYQGSCLQCVYDADCLGPHSTCDQTTRTCHAGAPDTRCTSDDNCGGAAPYCESNGECVGCRNHVDCTGRNGLCNAGICAPGCDSHYDCKSSQHPFCVFEQCAECRFDSDCEGGGTCSSGACHAAVDCTTNADCTDRDLPRCLPNGTCTMCADDTHCMSPWETCTTEFKEHSQIVGRCAVQSNNGFDTAAITMGSIAIVTVAGILIAGLVGLLKKTPDTKLISSEELDSEISQPSQ